MRFPAPFSSLTHALRNLGLSCSCVLLLAACGGEKKADIPAPPAPLAASDEVASAASSNSDNDCDAFLEGYEEYVQDYVALAKEMQADPSNTTLLARTSEMSMKAASWADKAKGCENDPTFQAKYLALSAKMASGMGQ